MNSLDELDPNRPSKGAPVSKFSPSTAKMDGQILTNHQTDDFISNSKRLRKVESMFAQIVVRLAGIVLSAIPILESLNFSCAIPGTQLSDASYSERLDTMTKALIKLCLLYDLKGVLKPSLGRLTPNVVLPDHCVSCSPIVFSAPDSSMLEDNDACHSFESSCAFAHIESFRDENDSGYTSLVSSVLEGSGNASLVAFNIRFVHWFHSKIKALAYAIICFWTLFSKDKFVYSMYCTCNSLVDY